MPRKQPDFDGQDVQPAPDARIHVEADDYIRAVPGDQFQCAMVWAIRRQYPTAKRIRANRGEISFSIGETRMHYPADEQIIELVIRPLDTGGELKPVTVRLHDGYAVPVEYADEEALTRKRNQMAEKSAQARRNINPASTEAAKRGFRRFRPETEEGNPDE